LAILVLDDFSTGYGDKVLLRNFSCSFEKASFYAIVGNNGCGKSTFIKSFYNLHSYSGNVLFDGLDIRNLSSGALNKSVVYLEQKNHLQFNLPVRELVVMGQFRKKKFLESYDKQDFEKVEAVLDLLEISSLADKNIHNLSGGEQQLVWLAQIIIQDPDIFLLDEPTQHLDLYFRKKIFTILAQLVEEKGKTIITTTHDIANLRAINGFYLNLSETNPQFKNITPEHIDGVIKNLETRR
jgi:iron complex transport system ATP-binding protein